jgi:hypothetical protein
MRCRCSDTRRSAPLGGRRRGWVGHHPGGGASRSRGARRRGQRAGPCQEPATQEYSTLGAARRRRRPYGAPSRNAPTGRESFLPGLLSRIDQQSRKGSRVACLPVKCGLPRRLDERGVLDDLEVLAGDLVLAQMVGGDGNLQHLKSGLDLLGSRDVLLVILRRVQLCGDGCG